MKKNNPNSARNEEIGGKALVTIPSELEVGKSCQPKSQQYLAST